RLDFTPPAPEPLGVKGKDPGQQQLESLGNWMKSMASLMGTKKAPPPVARGYWGIELAEREGAVTVARGLPETPASAAGLKAGDRILEVGDKEVRSSADVLRRAAGVTAGRPVRLTVQRGDAKHDITVTAGEGL